MKPFHSRHDSGSLSATETDTDSSESNVPSINGTNRDESLSDTDLDDSGELFLSDAGAERNESPAPEDFSSHSNSTRRHPGRARRRPRRFDDFLLY